MRGELALATLLYIKRRVLTHSKCFTTKDCFVDAGDNSLPPKAPSLPKVMRRNIAGAVIEALVELGIDENASDHSSDYFAVMHRLGEAARPDLANQNIKPKVEAVMQINNQKGYEGTLKLIEKTAAGLFHDLMWKD